MYVLLPAIYVSNMLYIQSELSGSQRSVVGRVVAEALADDFTTGFRPEDSSHQHHNE